MKLKDIVDGKNDVKIYYLELPEDLNSEDRDFYIKDLGVENLPMIISIRSGKIENFGYDKITSKTYRKKFEKFVIGNH